MHLHQMLTIILSILLAFRFDFLILEKLVSFHVIITKFICLKTMQEISQSQQGRRHLND